MKYLVIPLPVVESVLRMSKIDHTVEFQGGHEINIHTLLVSTHIVHNGHLGWARCNLINGTLGSKVDFIERMTNGGWGGVSWRDLLGG